jgi:glutamyl-tRNA reductase
MRDVLLVLGVSHHTATLPTRERVALTEGDSRAMLRRLGADGRLSETIVLSTCNRTELYAVAGRPTDGEAALRQALQGHTGLGAAALACSSYVLADDAAIEHLFRVAAGLDSAVVGESEIVAQLRGARTLAREEGTAGRLLEGAFGHALVAGRHVRRRATIGRGSTSLATVVAKAAIAHQHDRGVLVIGAGPLAGSVARALSSLGARGIMIANRTESAARRLATAHDLEVVPLGALARALPRADAVVSATGAPRPILTREQLEAIAPSSRPRAIFDLAVPRDVEPTAATLPGLVLQDLEHLQGRLALHGTARRTAMEHADALVRDEVRRFASWRANLALAPAVRSVWQRAEDIRRAELARCGTLDPAELARLEAVTARLVRKLLDGPTKRLREAAREPGAPHLEVFRDLFDVGEAPATPVLRAVERHERGAA